MDYIKYVIILFWLGPIFFLTAAVLRYIDRHVTTPYIVDIAASSCFLIALTTELICKNLEKKKPKILENAMHIVYAIAPFCYFTASLCRVLKVNSLATNIMDLCATILFFTGTNIRFSIEIMKGSYAFICVVSIYWSAHVFFICAFVSYIIDIDNKLGNYFEMISGCFFVIAATIWLLGEILIRNCGLVLEKDHNLDLIVLSE